MSKSFIFRREPAMFSKPNTRNRTLHHSIQISCETEDTFCFQTFERQTFLRINPMPCTHFRTIVKYLQRQALFGTQNKKQTMSLLLAGLPMRISLKNGTHNACSASSTIASSRPQFVKTRAPIAQSMSKRFNVLTAFGSELLTAFALLRQYSVRLF